MQCLNMDREATGYPPVSPSNGTEHSSVQMDICTGETKNFIDIKEVKSESLVENETLTMNTSENIMLVQHDSVILTTSAQHIATDSLLYQVAEPMQHDTQQVVTEDSAEYLIVTSAKDIATSPSVVTSVQSSVRVPTIASDYITYTTSAVASYPEGTQVIHSIHNDDLQQTVQYNIATNEGEEITESNLHHTYKSNQVPATYEDVVQATMEGEDQEILGECEANIEGREQTNALELQTINEDQEVVEEELVRTVEVPHITGDSVHGESMETNEVINEEESKTKSGQPLESHLVAVVENVDGGVRGMKYVKYDRQGGRCKIIKGTEIPASAIGGKSASVEEDTIEKQLSQIDGESSQSKNVSIADAISRDFDEENSQDVADIQAASDDVIEEVVNISDQLEHGPVTVTDNTGQVYYVESVEEVIVVENDVSIKESSSSKEKEDQTKVTMSNIPSHMLGRNIENPVEDTFRNGKVPPKPRLGVKIPYKNLTSQIVSKDEIAREILERQRAKFAEQRKQAGDAFFTRRLTQRLARKIGIKEPTADSSTNEMQDSDDLLAILEGNDESDKPDPSTIAKKEANVIIDKELEKQIALKQLSELPKHGRRRKKPSYETERTIETVKIPPRFNKLKVDTSAKAQQGTVNKEIEQVAETKVQDEIQSKFEGVSNMEVEVNPEVDINLENEPIVENEQNFRKESPKKALQKSSKIEKGQNVEKVQKLEKKQLIDNFVEKSEEQNVEKEQEIEKEQKIENEQKTDKVQKLDSEPKVVKIQNTDKEQKTEKVQKPEKPQKTEHKLESKLESSKSDEQKLLEKATKVENKFLQDVSERKFTNPPIKTYERKRKSTEEPTITAEKVLSRDFGSSNPYITKSSRIIKKKVIWDPAEPSTARYAAEKLSSPKAYKVDDKKVITKSPSAKEVQKISQKPIQKEVTQRESPRMSSEQKLQIDSKKSPKEPQKVSEKTTRKDIDKSKDTKEIQIPQKEIQKSTVKESPKIAASDKQKSPDTPGKYKKRLSEVDKLLMDEGAVNMLYSVKNEDTKKFKGSTFSVDKVQKDLLNKTNEIKKELTSSTDRSSPKSLRRKESPVATPTRKLAASAAATRKKSRDSVRSSLHSPPASPLGYAEASRIIRRHSSSSYSSLDGDQDVEEVETENKPGKRKAPQTEGVKKRVKTDMELEKAEKAKLNDENFSKLVEHQSTAMDFKFEYRKFDEYQAISVRQLDNLVEAALISDESNHTYLTKQVLIELTQLLTELENDTTCNVVVVSSSASAFCNGVDYKSLSIENASDRKEAAVSLASSVISFLKTLASFPKIVVAGINGDCVGLGVTMLPLYDMVIASNTATFSILNAKLGCAVEGGSLFSLPHLMNTVLVCELLYATRKLSAAEALRMGMITRVTGSEKFHQELFAAVKIISSNSLQFMQLTKKQLRYKIMQEIEGLLKGEVDSMVESWISEECQNSFKDCD